MKTYYTTPVLVAIAALMAACGSVPNSTSLLDQTRSDYAMAQSNPNVATYAPLELKQAGDALNQANAVANDNGSAENIDKLAYLAKQKIALTQEIAKQKAAEADVANASKERDQVRLDQRTNEANAANISADKAKQATLVAQSNAAQARVQTEIAQIDAAISQRQAQEAQARAAQLEAQLTELAAKKTERGIVITLGDVLFGTDLARLNTDGIRTAQKLANVLQQNPQRKVLVEGFADSTGSAAHNQDLSERRANAVRGALQDLGVAAERIAVRGYGETYPVAANDTAQNRQLNRRVEIVLSDDSGKLMPR
jgi:outer membrane protein OmpA-like peptidoglycan-associated protein